MARLCGWEACCWGHWGSNFIALLFQWVKERCDKPRQSLWTIHTYCSFLSLTFFLSSFLPSLPPLFSPHPSLLCSSFPCYFSLSSGSQCSYVMEWWWPLKWPLWPMLCRQLPNCRFLSAKALKRHSVGAECEKRMVDKLSEHIKSVLVTGVKLCRVWAKMARHNKGSFFFFFKWQVERSLHFFINFVFANLCWLVRTTSTVIREWYKKNRA